MSKMKHFEVEAFYNCVVRLHYVVWDPCHERNWLCVKSDHIFTVMLLLFRHDKIQARDTLLSIGEKITFLAALIRNEGFLFKSVCIIDKSSKSRKG